MEVSGNFIRHGNFKENCRCSIGILLFQTVQHGFPNKPTALAWDPALRLLALGTATGAIKIFGKPGVEFYGQHSNHDSAVTRLIFLPNEVICGHVLT
uniref:Uncharacterized protein n=1 Tax=Timema monikensis TaxID=170555 RepID=A0A7R9HPP7_9NEOP|nr:unnamed protein product [Timema monikensis]